MAKEKNNKPISAGKIQGKTIEELWAENKWLWELLEMAASQLRYIGCFCGCDNGVMRDSSGKPCRCQCCDEQNQIENALKLKGKVNDG